MMKYKTKTTILLSSIFAALAITVHSQTVLVTIAEDSGQQSSTLTGVNEISFDELSNGNYTNLNWSGVGIIDSAMVHQGGTVFGAFDSTSPWGINSQQMTVGNIVYDPWGTEINTTTIFLDTPSAYFGLYWSAGDGDDLLQFYNGSNLVAEFSTDAIVDNASLTSEYYGDPYQGTNTIEPYAFINFYGDVDTNWDTIVLTQDTGATSGFEVDNLTSRIEAFNAGDDISQIGKVVAEVSDDVITFVTEETTSWYGFTAGSAPAAPAPTTLSLLLFLLIFMSSCGKRF